MTELDPAAERTLDRRLKAIAKRLGKAGHDAEDIDIVVDGLREQVHDMIASGDAADAGAIDAALDSLERSADWSEGAGADSGHGLAKLALGIACATAPAAIIGAMIADAMGGDGGAILVTTGLAGFAVALILSVLHRRTVYGRAAFVLSTIGLALFVLLLIWSVIG
ncbi:hypothetical protein [Parasphingopyxis sp.]|uniref:hypothetical protein n=1 Tax=Parasphingopyxis sp. TaxID=1920299 RepID=UPI0026117B48|nr:hypothetical protein [Parasphingopyxis sp.]